MGDFGRALAQLLAVAAIGIFALANLAVDFQISAWPSWMRVTLFFGTVSLLTLVFVLIIGHRRHP
jgi:hypothetical protein